MKTIIKKSNNLKTVGRKTFQKDGHWIENPNKTIVLVCFCGNKYIKTRALQVSCLRCAK